MFRVLGSFFVFGVLAATNLEGADHLLGNRPIADIADGVTDPANPLTDFEWDANRAEFRLETTSGADSPVNLPQKFTDPRITDPARSDFWLSK